MKKCLALNALVLWGLFLIVPQAVQAKVDATLVSANGNNVKVSISLDRIEDIDGCTISTCLYWQMVFERQEVFDTTTYHRYYSSDVFLGDQLSATYTFHLPAGDYSNFTLQGYATSQTGNCGYEEYSDICPDDKHISGELSGITGVNDPSFISFIFLVRDRKTALIIHPQQPLVPPQSGVGEPSSSDLPVIALLTTPAPRVVDDDMLDPVTYEYTVWNVGVNHNQTLTDIAVTDDTCSPVTFLGGDLNSDGKLNEGENWEYECITRLPETTTNTATAIGYSDDASHQAATASTVTTVVVVSDQGLEGTVPLPDTEVSPSTAPASDTAPLSDVVFFPNTGTPPIDAEFYSDTGLRRPLIQIERTANHLNLLIFEGRETTYTYFVTNPGVVPVHDIVVTDTACAPISYLSGKADEGNLIDQNETWVYTCTTTHSGASRSIAAVVGRANGFTPMDVFITNPGLTSTGVAILTLLAIEVILVLVAVVLLKHKHKIARRLTRIKKWIKKRLGL